ncbi:MAG: hypothetical protein HYW34_04185 [Candidatus Brennerbacteria bacterium]|nr:hypothetical protein [Candidatus Brennerbacteria bacterium]
MDFKSKPLIFIYIIVAVIIAASGFWYWQSKELIPEPSGSLGSSESNVLVIEKNQNPIENQLPATNPFEVKTNPFENAYKNPFDK